MRTFSAALAGFLLFAASSLAAGRPDYQIVKISPGVDLTPQISFQYGPQQHPAPRSQQWLEVEVNFTSNVDWTDELTFRYYILLAGKCLTGEVTHVAIQKGRELYSVMYVPPQAIARILNGRPLTGIDIQDVGVEIVLKGQVLTTKSFKAVGTQEWWQNMQQVTGLVFNKDQTPFSALIWDRYEAIKAAGAP